LPSEGLFPGSPPAMTAATDGDAWIAAMLEVERALALAEERAGVVPPGAAAAVDEAARAFAMDAGTLRAEGARAGTPVIPLVRALAGSGASWVHWGATSQDVIDSALALVARRASRVLVVEIDGVVVQLGALADRYRATTVVGRTLMQHAAPTTFGLKAAGWLLGLIEAAEDLQRATDAFPAQLGGSVGTLGVLGTAAPEVLREFAAELGLPEPVIPWHAARAPVARLGAALGLVAGGVRKAAGDLVLLAQGEVGEIAERAEPGRGVSSAMPNKRNPVGAINALAAARRAAPLASALVNALDHEHERAAGALQAEAPMMCELFGHAASAVAALADALTGLEVNEDKMAANLLRSGDWAAEQAAAALAPVLGRARAHEWAATCVSRTDGDTASMNEVPISEFVDALLADPAVSEQFDRDRLAAALDASAALASVGVFVDRALARQTSWRQRR
jgi:3-carboxy-cis,cis-muconate cycloisomerase